jgi:hypothetical protein
MTFLLFRIDMWWQTDDNARRHVIEFFRITEEKHVKIKQYSYRNRCIRNRRVFEDLLRIFFE